ncbi:MAG: purine-nucleoside phosphorylase [Acutalibacteraceae bacterium]
MATPHNAAKKGDIAPFVLMPGDPLRARWISETYLQNPVCFNSVRGMLGYTGLYHGKRVSVMGSGMGCPSMGIYAYELFQEYGVDTVIRIGTAGALQPDLPVRHLVIATKALCDCGFAAGFAPDRKPVPDGSLCQRAQTLCQERHIPFACGPVVTSDFFYPTEQGTAPLLFANQGALCVEMETLALYLTAQSCHGRALSLLTISDQLCTGEALSHEERETSLRLMVEMALALAEG